MGHLPRPGARAGAIPGPDQVPLADQPGSGWPRAPALINEEMAG